MTAYELNQDDILAEATADLVSGADLLMLASAVMMANGFLTAGGIAAALAIQVKGVVASMLDITTLDETDDVEQVKVQASKYITTYLTQQKKKAQALEDRESGF
jgi:hypothetical protein